MDCLPLSIDMKIQVLEKMSGKEIMKLYFKDESFKDLCEDLRAESLWRNKLCEDFGIEYDGKDTIGIYIEYYIKMKSEILKKKLKESRIRLENNRKEQFRKKWNEDFSIAFWKYQALVNSCCGQGGRGYHIWIPLNVDKPHHWVVLESKYKDCQPTEKDRDAYFAYYGKEMEVTKLPHIELWGN